MEKHTPRGHARWITAAASVLLLSLGAAACTGGDEEQPGPATTSTSATASAEAAPEESDGGGEGVTDADLTAATDRFLGFLGVIDDQDFEAACAYVLDPSTGTAPEGERLQECAGGAREAMAEYEQLLQPGAFDQLDASMVQAEPGEDGSVSLSLLEQPVDVPMIRGDDGHWYLSIPF